MPSTQKEPSASRKTKKRSRLGNRGRHKENSKLTARPSLFERLPTEILCEIATLYLSETNNLVLITQVCRRLRQVVLQMASIWRRITLLGVGSGYGYENVRKSSFWNSNVFLSLNRIK
jgi:hypothetical protein